MNRQRPPARVSLPGPAHSGLDLATVLGLQLGLVALALALGLLPGLEPLARLRFDLQGLWLGLAAALPPLAALGLLHRFGAGWAWVRELDALMRQLTRQLWRGAPRGAVLAVALLAGIGEELIFRGLVQDGLEGWLGAPLALWVSALLFGLLHAMTPAYFVLATLMGLYLGLSYLASGNLLVPILAHAAYDWAVFQYYRRLVARDAGSV